MLHAAGVEFEDIRLSVPEEYYKVPLGKLFLTFHKEFKCAHLYFRTTLAKPYF